MCNTKKQLGDNRKDPPPPPKYFAGYSDINFTAFWHVSISNE